MGRSEGGNQGQGKGVTPVCRDERGHERTMDGSAVGQALPKYLARSLKVQSRQVSTLANPGPSESGVVRVTDLRTRAGTEENNRKEQRDLEKRTRVWLSSRPPLLFCLGSSSSYFALLLYLGSRW